MMGIGTLQNIPVEAEYGKDFFLSLNSFNYFSAWLVIE